MKKTKSVNNIMISTINPERQGKYKNIMNSPNFGKQQIILQSCCFFDYDKYQTPKAQSPNISYIRQNKNRINSSKVSEKSKNIFSKNHTNMDLIKSKFDEMRKNEVDKLKNENKVLKDTINNLILQLEKTFRIAENVKHKEKNISQMNTHKENEILNMKNKINSLIFEKQQLLNQIKTQETTVNTKRNSWSNYQSPKFGHKRNISFTDFGYNKIKNKSICFTENNDNEQGKNQKVKDNKNRLNEENTKLNMENINNNKENSVLFDKRLNKRKYIFNKKKTSREYPLMKSRNIIETNDNKNNHDNLKEKYENFKKEGQELKISFNGSLNECDNSRIKYNTEEISFTNDNSFIHTNSNSTNNFTQLKQENKIKNLEIINYDLKSKLDSLEKKERIKYDLLMNKYNKLFSESTQLKSENNKQIKNKEEIIQEMNNKYNKLMQEYNNKNSVFNNLKAKYDQLLRINNNNINIINTNRIKMNEVIMENSQIKNELRKKTDEITQKNIEIGRFKKIVNDLNELKNIEKKLKQNHTQNETKKCNNENMNNNHIENNDMNKLLKEIEEYKIQINRLNNEKEELEKENNNLKGNRKEIIQNSNEIINNQSLLEEYKNKISKLEEKNKKLEKFLTKANQELDQYEIESKEADIEIKSFKMKINELLEEIKKLKHKETIEEVIEENYEEEEDKKENN